MTSTWDAFPGYEDVVPLGKRGAAGTLFVGKSKESGRRVAIKLFDKERGPSGLGDSSMTEFLALRALSGEDSPILRLESQTPLQCVSPSDSLRHPCFAMEYVDGIQLREVAFCLHKGKVGRMTDVQLAILAKDLFEQIAFVHRHGYVHGDVTDRNIMLTRDGKLRLVDFGMVTKIATGEEGLVRVLGNLRALGNPRVDVRFSARAILRLMPEMPPTLSPWSGTEGSLEWILSAAWDDGTTADDIVRLLDDYLETHL